MLTQPSRTRSMELTRLPPGSRPYPYRSRGRLGQAWMRDSHTKTYAADIPRPAPNPFVRTAAGGSTIAQDSRVRRFMDRAAMRHLVRFREGGAHQWDGR